MSGVVSCGANSLNRVSDKEVAGVVGIDEGKRNKITMRALDPTAMVRDLSWTARPLFIKMSVYIASPATQCNAARERGKDPYQALLMTVSWKKGLREQSGAFVPSSIFLVPCASKCV